MKNAEYRCETKEEQDKSWENYERFIRNEYDRSMSFLEEYKNGKCRKSEFVYVIGVCEMRMKGFIHCNMIEEAKKMANVGIILLDKYKDERRALYNDYLYEFDWFLNGKENADILKTDIDNKYKILYSPKKKKAVHMVVALDTIICGDFIKAREYLNSIYEVKPRSKLDKDTIYDVKKFCAFVVEYLCETEKNADMLPKLKECFRHLFGEEQKGSYRLVPDDKIDLSLRKSIFRMRLIWYKYFSGRDWDTVTFEEIVQSERYGIKGLQDC